MNFQINPDRVVFYEKPFCAGNKKQKQLLKEHNITFETRDILSFTWSREVLENFFEGLEKEEIYNQFAPQIKDGLIDIKTLSKDQLITKMLENPILIKRPLLEINEVKICGFDIEKINQMLNKNIPNNTQISVCQSNEPCTVA